jgi:hypothetical protein
MSKYFVIKRSDGTYLKIEYLMGKESFHYDYNLSNSSVFEDKEIDVYVNKALARDKRHLTFSKVEVIKDPIYIIRSVGVK